MSIDSNVRFVVVPPGCPAGSDRSKLVVFSSTYRTYKQPKLHRGEIIHLLATSRTFQYKNAFWKFPVNLVAKKFRKGSAGARHRKRWSVKNETWMFIFCVAIWSCLFLGYLFRMLVAFEFLNPEVLGIWSFCTGVELSTTGDDPIS